MMKPLSKLRVLFQFQCRGTNWIETFWAGVSLYPLLGCDEADSFNLRGGTVRAIYTRKKKTRPQ